MEWKLKFSRLHQKQEYDDDKEEEEKEDEEAEAKECGTGWRKRQYMRLDGGIVASAKRVWLKYVIMRVKNMCFYGNKSLSRFSFLSFMLCTLCLFLWY